MVIFMCRSIKPLFNFDPPVTEAEIRAAALQFVRKISGSTKPSKANEAAFLTAVEETVRPPAFAEFGRRLAALAPEYGTELMPIREALRVALEKVLLLERLAGPTASR